MTRTTSPPVYLSFVTLSLSERLQLVCQINVLYRINDTFRILPYYSRLMSLLPTLVNHRLGFDAALLALPHNCQTIYEHTRMTGENRSANEMLPVDCEDSSTDTLEALYAYSMAMYFDNAALYTQTRQKELLSEALLLMAQSQRSIYENTRISGENRIAKCMLPIDGGAEQFDCCSDALDELYADALASFFMSSRL